MSSILIVFGSGEGQTAKVAEFLADRLRDLNHKVDVVKGNRLPKGFDINAYDALIIAASVRMMKFQNYIVDFTRKYCSRLKTVPSAFVSISMSEAHPDSHAGGFQQEWLDKFVNETGWKPATFASFAGALMYRKYNFITRFVMKKIAQKSGLTTDTTRNHEFTDWEAVGRFADEFADSLP
jgi:menaquinone-dependent protoporphyrinogen oxidase